MTGHANTAPVQVSNHAQLQEALAREQALRQRTLLLAAAVEELQQIIATEREHSARVQADLDCARQMAEIARGADIQNGDEGEDA